MGRIFIDWVWDLIHFFSSRVHDGFGHSPGYRTCPAKPTVIEKKLLVLKAVQDCATITQTCRKHRIGEPTFYRWREKYAGMEKCDLARIRELGGENAHLRFVVADNASSL
jgi:putative transposase